MLLALQKFFWGADKIFAIGPKSSNKTVSHADLCFDGQHPVAQVQYDGRRLAFTLDTGATNTDLYPPFAAMFPELMRGAAKTDSYKMEGAGGTKILDAAVFAVIAFEYWRISSGPKACWDSAGVHRGKQQVLSREPWHRLVAAGS